MVLPPLRVAVLVKQVPRFADLALSRLPRSERKRGRTDSCRRATIDDDEEERH